MLLSGTHRLCSLLTFIYIVLIGCGGGPVVPASTNQIPAQPYNVITAVQVSGGLSLSTTDAGSQLEAIATYSDHSTKDITTSAVWAVATPTVAAISSSGRVTCIALGKSQVSASFGVVSGLANVSCSSTVSSLHILPNALAMSIGSGRQVSVSAINLKGTAVDVTSLVSWTGLAAGVTITPTGLVTCESPVRTSLIGTFSGQTSTIEVDCVPRSWNSRASFLENSNEFVGPFPSWINVKLMYGASGDGLHDDTQALQKAFDSLRTTPDTTVLWFPAGVYLIRSPLTLTHKQGVSIVGEDPRTTILKWIGTQSDTMLQTDGSSGFKISRLSFDGAGVADTAETITTSSTTSGGFYSTFNELSDQHIQGTRVGIRLTVDAETSLERIFFDHLPTYGLQVGNFNTLNIFITDSLFTGCGVGVTNWDGAGNFIVANSFFQGSTIADMSIGNTGYFTARHNSSTASNAFFVAGPIGQNAALITIQNNTILDPTSTPFQLGDEGPLMLLDNVVRMHDPTLPTVLGNNDLSAPKSIFSFGNTFTFPFRVETQGSSLFQGYVQSYDDTVVTPADIPDVLVPSMVYTPPNLRRSVYEVPVGSTGDGIQNQIDAAFRSRDLGPVVHIPNGMYPLSNELRFGPGSTVQVVGDGPYSTLLVWNGNASKAAIELDRNSVSVKDLQVSVGSGSAAADGIRINIDDQPRTHVLINQALLQGNNTVKDEYSVNLDGIDHANVELFSTYTLGTITGVNVRGGDFRSSGRGAVGLTNFYTGSMQSTGNATSFSVSEGGKFLVQDNWHDGGLTSPRNFVLSGTGTVTEQSGEVAMNSDQPFEVNDFNGKITLMGLMFSGGFDIHSGRYTTNLLNLGLQGTSSTYLPQPQTGLQVANIFDMYYAGGAKPIQPSDMPDPQWLRSMLAQTRSEYPVSRLPLAPGASRNRLERIIAFGFSSAVHVVPTAGTHALAYTLSIHGIPFSSEWRAQDNCDVASSANSFRTRWTLVEAGDGDYRLQQADGDMVLGTSDTIGREMVGLRSRDGGYSERWSILPVGDGQSFIRNRASNLLLSWSPGKCPQLLKDANALDSHWSLGIY